jgi:hypothetical protein
VQSQIKVRGVGTGALPQQRDHSGDQQR